MMLALKLAVVILNWNAAADTIRCLETLAAWPQLRPTLYVVDNASAPGSADRIAAAFPRARLLRNAENLGFAGGVNVGLRAALAAGDAPILLLNNDAALDEEAALCLLALLEESPAAGVVGPLLYRSGGELISAGSRNPVLHHHNLIDRPADAHAPYPVDYISGSVALLRPAMLRHVGLLDERYFFSGEVADLCARARRAGWRTLVEPRARALHDLERSSPLRSTLYTYYIVRNRFLYIRNHYRLARLPLLAAWTLYGAAAALRLRLAGAAAPGRAVLLGTADGLRGRFGGENERVLAACGPHAPLPAAAQP